MPPPTPLQPSLAAAVDLINEQTVSRNEFCKLLGIHLNTCDHWLSKGKLPHYKIDVLVRIPRTVVDELLAERA
jgi:excisionase family DNA binding protein